MFPHALLVISLVVSQGQVAPSNGAAAPEEAALRAARVYFLGIDGAGSVLTATATMAKHLRFVVSTSETDEAGRPRVKLEPIETDQPKNSFSVRVAWCDGSWMVAHAPVAVDDEISGDPTAKNRAYIGSPSRASALVDHDTAMLYLAAAAPSERLRPDTFATPIEFTRGLGEGQAWIDSFVGLVDYPFEADPSTHVRTTVPHDRGLLVVDTVSIANLHSKGGAVSLARKVIIDTSFNPPLPVHFSFHFGEKQIRTWDLTWEGALSGPSLKRMEAHGFAYPPTGGDAHLAKTVVYENIERILQGCSAIGTASRVPEHYQVVQLDAVEAHRTVQSATTSASSPWWPVLATVVTGVGVALIPRAKSKSPTRLMME